MPGSQATRHTKSPAGLRRKTFIRLLFLAGLAIVLYPIIASAINARSQSYVISSYDEQAAKISAEEKARQEQSAQAYNESLSGGSATITDPFNKGDSPVSGVSYADMLATGDAMGHLEIPKLNLDLPIYHGISDAVLQNGIGHIEQTSLPIGGVDTNAVLVGHRGVPTSILFRNLNEMAIGDVFYIHIIGDTLAYQVVDVNIVRPGDIDLLKIQKGRDLVTLVTCEPYMINSHRLLVTGERIPYVPATVEEQSDIMTWVTRYWAYLAVSLLIIPITTVVIRAYRKRKRTQSDGDPE